MVSYGGGVNSTALLIGLHQHRIPVDLILFADTGAEHPHTYAYLDIMDRWLKDHGMPPITRVYKTTRDSKRLTLEQECLQSGTLPSIAYGFKRCSLKHKIGPQEKFCNHYLPCQKVWAAGKRVVKFIGYDAGEGYRSDKVLLGGLNHHEGCLFQDNYDILEKEVHALIDQVGKKKLIVGSDCTLPGTMPYERIASVAKACASYSG